MKQTARELHLKIRELERKLMADNPRIGQDRNHKALFHRIPQKMHPTQRLAQEMLYLKDAIDLAWELGAYEAVNSLAANLLSVRRQYKLEMIRPA